MNGIIFENIDTGETALISLEAEGKFYKSKLAAIMNSSNISPNADRGQDYGWRLQPEQQAVLEMWESDPDMIEKVAAWGKIPTDGMEHADFLAYLLHQQELGKSPEKEANLLRRENQLAYDERVAKLKAQDRPEPLAPFGARYGLDRKDASLDDFLNGRLDDTDDEEELPAETEVDDTPAEAPADFAPETTEPPVVDEAPVLATPDTTVKVEDGVLTAPETDGKTSTKRTTKK